MLLFLSSIDKGKGANTLAHMPGWYHSFPGELHLMASNIWSDDTRIPRAKRETNPAIPSHQNSGCSCVAAGQELLVWRRALIQREVQALYQLRMLQIINMDSIYAGSQQMAACHDERARARGECESIHQWMTVRIHSDTHLILCIQTNYEL